MNFFPNNLFSTGEQKALQNISAGTALSRSLSAASYPTFMAFGNSIMRLQRINGYSGGINQVGGYGWLWWALSFLGQPFRPVLTGDEQVFNANASLRDGVGGWSGGTSVDIAGLLPTVMSGRSINVGFLQMMENDPIQVDAAAITLAQCLAAYRSGISTMRAAGATEVVFIGCGPSSDFATTGKASAYHSLVALAQQACTEAGAIYVPIADLYTDGSSAFPIPLNSGSYANNVFTNVHPMQIGIKIGERVADVLAARGYSAFAVGAPQPFSATKHIHGNAFMSGSGGAVSGGYTGAAPATITVLTDASSPTCSSALTNIGGRQAVDIVFTAGAQTGIKTIAQVYAATYGTTGYSIGDLVSSYIDMEFTAALTGVRTVEVQTVFQGLSGTLYPFMNSVTSGDLISMPFPINRRMRIMTPIIAVPVGTTGIRETAKILAASGAASVACNARVYGCGVINWSAAT